ncbi:MAG: nicotinate phosphoribosyltransferase [Thermoprotei archaeon]|nr:MAG: nicotinate phosphoribosyltransferase [Thermoprotei archaeon]
MERRLYIATDDIIRAGKVTDVYFVRTKQILERKGLSNVKVKAEFSTYSLPKNYRWAVFTGLEEVLKLLEGLPINVWAMPEGTIYREMEPVMVIEGSYAEFCVYETAVLGILRHSTSIATKAARCKKLAGDKLVVFFGLRALHPAIAPMADRAAYIGGCDGVSGVYSSEVLGLKPIGTMPHALIVVFGDQVKAWKAFDEVMPPDVPRICLCDTFYDERIESLMAAEALKDRLYGVRLDTPSSRRGNFLKIVREVRWALDLAGYRHVKIIVSGGIDEEEIKQLRDYVDGFGIGTAIACPPPVDMSMDVVEVYDEVSGKWVPRSKRGKLPGMKQVYRCKECFSDFVVPWGREVSRCSKCGGEVVPLLKKFMEEGQIVERLPTVSEIRSYVLEQLKKVEL